MTFAASVFSRTRRVNARVIVGGVPQTFFLDPLDNVTRGNILSISRRFHIDQPVPTATVRFKRLPSSITYNDRITILEGFDGFEAVTFQGFVVSIQRTHLETTIECEGTTRQAEVAFTKDGYTFSSVVASTAVGSLLDKAGLVDRSIDMEAWTIGDQQDAVVDVNTLGEAIRKIIEVDGHRMWMAPGGGVIIRQLELFPAGSVFATYETQGSQPMILAGQQKMAFDQVRNQVTVRGASLTTVDSDGNQTTTQIEQVATGTTPYAPRDSAGNEVLLELLYQNELIQDNTKAAAVAVRLLGEALCPVIDTEVEIVADPRIALGMTIGITDTYTGLSGRWIVVGYQSVLEAGRYNLRVEVKGGPLSCGAGNLSPVADFTWRQEREFINTNDPKVIVSYVSAAYDLDGTIASWSWSDDQGNTSSEERVSFAYSESLIVVTMTLTVTDNSGATASISKTVDLTKDSVSGPGPVIPAFFDAAENYQMWTPNGGASWTDWLNTAVGVGGQLFIVCDMAQPDPEDVDTSGLANTILLAGTDGGTIVRSDDTGATWTIALAAVGSAMNDVRFNGQSPQEAWACTQDGRIYRSLDAGLTWALYQSMGFELHHVEVRGDGTVFAGGGDTGAPATLVSFDLRDGLGFRWIAPGTAASSINLLPAGGTVKEIGLSDYIEQDFSIILDGVEPAIHWLNADPIVGGDWQAAVGLDVGLSVGRSIAWAGWLPGRLLAIFNTRDTWITDDGVNWTKQANVFGAGITPFKLAGPVNEQTDVFLIGASDGVYKTFDRGLTVGYVRPIAGISAWPAGNNARWVSFGVGAPLPGGFLHAQGANASGVDRTPAALVKDTLAPWRRIALGAISPVPIGLARQFWNGTTELLFLCATEASDPQVMRSVDGGDTWDYTNALTGAPARALVRDVSGNLWVSNGGRTARSQDQGATWSAAGLHLDGGGAVGKHFTAHPTDPTRFYELTNLVASMFSVGVSTDTFVTVTHRDIANGSNAARIAVNRNGRIFILMTDSADSITRLRYSDDDGVTWTIAKDFGESWSSASNDGSIQLKLLSGGLYAFGARTGATLVGRCWRGDEQGETWVELYGAGGYTAPYPAADEWEARGLDVDPFTGDVYMSVFLSTAVPPVHIMRLRAGETAWTDNDVGLNTDLSPVVAAPGELDVLALRLAIS